MHTFTKADILAAEYRARDTYPLDGPAPAMTDEQYAQAFAEIARDNMALFVTLRATHEAADLLHSQGEVASDELARMLTRGLDDATPGSLTPQEALYLGTLAYEAIRRFMIAAAPGVHHCEACGRHGCYGCEHTTGVLRVAALAALPAGPRHASVVGLDGAPVREE